MELNLDYETLGREYPDQFIAGVDEANAIFDLPNSRQTLQYFHAAAGFPTKETFLEAVRAGNFATWGSHDHTHRKAFLRRESWRALGSG